MIVCKTCGAGLVRVNGWRGWACSKSPRYHAFIGDKMVVETLGLRGFLTRRAT